MSEARERIAHQLASLHDNAVSGNESTREYLLGIGVDHIVAIVREEMLSPKSVQAAHSESFAEIFTPAGGEPVTAILANPRDVINAAVDATFGAELVEE